MNREKVSIVIPAFNSGADLETCLRSASDQSYRQLEILVIDDGSTDDTVARARNWAAKDPRIRVHSQRNQGPAAARNRGLALCQGEFVAFLDADDRLHPRFVERLLSRGLRFEADMVLGLSSFVSARSGQAIPNPFHERSPLPRRFKSFTYREIVPWFFSMDMVCWAKLFRVSYLKRNRIRFPTGFYPEDVPFVVSAMTAGGRIALAREILYRHRWNRPGSLTGRGSRVSFDAARAAERVERILRARAAPASLLERYSAWKVGFVLNSGYPTARPSAREAHARFKREARRWQARVSKEFGEEHWFCRVMALAQRSPRRARVAASFLEACYLMDRSR